MGKDEKGKTDDEKAADEEKESLNSPSIVDCNGSDEHPPKPAARRKKLPIRPKIKIPAINTFTFPQSPNLTIVTSYGQTNPVTPNSAQPHVIYLDKASDFFSTFRGIKDWTKSGLSVGEKSALWFYEKVMLKKIFN